MKKLALLILVLLTVWPAYAHRINAFADYSEGKLTVMSYFSDGTPVRNARVTVIDSKGTIVAEGFTDADGIFSIELPPSNYKIVVNESLGHKTETEIVLTPKEKGIPTKKVLQKEQLRGVSQLEERILQKLNQIEKTLNRIRVIEIIGGLGWIVGIFGIIALLKSKS